MEDRLQLLKKERKAIDRLTLIPEQMKRMLAIYYDREIEKIKREELEEAHGIQETRRSGQE